MKADARLRRLPLMRLDQWPHWLAAAWAAARSESGSLFNHTPTRNWSANTWRIAEEGLSKLITLLGAEKLEAQTDTVMLVTESHLVELVRSMQNNGLTIRTQQTYLTGIWLAARVLAPSHDWQWIRTGIDGLRRNVSSRRLIEAAGIGSDALVDLGKRRFREAWVKGVTCHTAQAVRARDGLIVAFLALRPLRKKNLAALSLGEHVRIEGDSVRIIVEISEMKGQKRGYESEWPRILLPEFRCYVEEIRPQLISCQPRDAGAAPAGNALWVSEDGTRLTADAIYRQVRLLTAKAFGQPINLHRFRHFAATTLAIHQPEDIQLTPEILGHRDPRSKEFYIQADQLSVIRRSHMIEDRLLSATEFPNRCRESTRAGTIALP
jgi:integrase/recombinase XerD